MQEKIGKKINVDVRFRSFEDVDPEALNRGKRMAPLSFQVKGREEEKIVKVLRSIAQTKGPHKMIHFNIKTDKERYYHLVFDSKKMEWTLMYELEDDLSLKKEQAR